MGSSATFTDLFFNQKMEGIAEIAWNDHNFKCGAIL